MKYFLKAVLVLITAIAAASCAAAAPADKGASGNNGPVYDVVNPSFESGLSGWTETGGGSGLVYITNESTNGTQSAYILCTNTGYTNGLDQYVSYRTNQTYKLSALLKDSVPNYKIMLIELCDTASNRLSTPYLSSLTLYGWSGWIGTNVVLAPTNVPGFIRVSFMVWKRISSIAELFVDGVVLTNY
jgi:hypothetical protein